MNRIFELIYNLSISYDIQIDQIDLVYNGIKRKYEEVCLHFKMFDGECFYKPNGVEWILTSEESNFCDSRYGKDLFIINFKLILKDYNNYIRQYKINNLLNESN